MVAWSPFRCSRRRSRRPISDTSTKRQGHTSRRGQEFLTEIPGKAFAENMRREGPPGLSFAKTGSSPKRDLTRYSPMGSNILGIRRVAAARSTPCGERMPGETHRGAACRCALKIPSAKRSEFHPRAPATAFPGRRRGQREGRRSQVAEDDVVPAGNFASSESPPRIRRCSMASSEVGASGDRKEGYPRKRLLDPLSKDLARPRRTERPTI